MTRSGASAGPRRRARRSAAPRRARLRPGGSGVLASDPAQGRPPALRAPSLPRSQAPLSLLPSGDCGAPTRRGWGGGCRSRGAPRRAGGSDPPAPAAPHSPLRPPRPSAPLPHHAETPRPGRPPPPVSRRRSRRAGGGPGGRGRGRGGAARPEPGARPCARLGSPRGGRPRRQRRTMDGLPCWALRAACLLLLAAGWLGPEARGSPTPPPSPAAPPPPPPPGASGGSQDTCASCGGFRRPEELGRVDGDFLEAVKRHILSRLQMRGRPNITHAVPKAAMVTALRKLHAGKVREDGRVEIPHLDGHASPGADGQERVSEIISFAETGGWVLLAARSGPRVPPPSPSPRPPAPDSQPGRSPRGPVHSVPVVAGGRLRNPGSRFLPTPPAPAANTWPSTRALRRAPPAPLGARPPPG